MSHMDLLLEVRDATTLNSIRLSEYQSGRSLLEDLGVFTDEYYDSHQKDIQINFYTSTCKTSAPSYMINRKIIATCKCNPNDIFYNIRRTYAFTWDASKSEANTKKHNVSFLNDVIPLFDKFVSQKLYIFKDYGWAKSSTSNNTPTSTDEYNNQESRFVYLGYNSSNSKIYYVVYCIRRDLGLNAPIIRVISARTLNHNEFSTIITRFGEPTGKGKSFLSNIHGGG